MFVLSHGFILELAVCVETFRSGASRHEMPSLLHNLREEVFFPLPLHSRMVSVSPDPNDEVLDADCWDLPSNDASNIDVAPLLLFSLALLLSGDGSPAVPGPAAERILRRCGSRDRRNRPRVQVAGGRKRRRFDLQSLRPPSFLRRRSRRAQVRVSHRSVPTSFSLYRSDSDPRNPANRLEPSREATEVAVEPSTAEFAPYFDPAAHIGGGEDDAAAAQALGNRSASPRDAVDPQRMVNPSPYAANLGCRRATTRVM